MSTHLDIAPQYQSYSARTRQEFREDYSDMRSWGMTHEQIAVKLGIKRLSLLRRCSRHDIYIPEAHERATYARLDELIESGVPFTVQDLPIAAPGVNGGALRHATGTGRIHCLGFEPGPHGGVTSRPRIWQSTAVDVLAVAS